MTSSGLSPELPEVVAIVGPTGVGKSAVGVELALRVNGEVVSCDSQQVYRGMDIGTATPTEKERRGVPHHLLSMVEPGTRYHAMTYRRDAVETIHGIVERGRRPILLGGTGFYLQALVEGLCEAPESALEVRERIQARVRKEGLETLYRELRELDPVAAERIHPNDWVRISRALEVYEQTGKPLSSFWGQRSPAVRAIAIGLTMPLDMLTRRIKARVDRMMDCGFLEEVRVLVGRVPRKALNVLGYNVLADHLLGKISLDEAVEQIKRDTRRYAKRQLTWFKKRGGVKWYELKDGFEPGRVAESILKRNLAHWIPVS